MIEYYVGLSPMLKSTLIITFALMITLIIIGQRVSKLKTNEVPGGITLLFVKLVEMVNDNQREYFKKYWKVFTPLLFTILLFLGFANTAALFGLNAPLSNFTVAISFSVFAFSTIQISALIINRPINRLKDLMDPNPLFLPINLIGEVSTPFAMGLRLFGNLVSGSIIAVLVYAVLGWVGILAGPFLHAVFDVFFGVVQAYVYYMLLSIFLSMAVEE
jgi:F-type H+-transporting ATPase subunit a